MMEQKIITNVIIHTDGGSRNNPGNAAIGFVIEDMAGNVLETSSSFIGIATNNEAEYQALLAALTHVRANYPTCTEVAIFSDSELMICQLTGVYKIREPHLQVIATSIHELLKTFTKSKLTHVLRKENKLADKLVNEALDAEELKRK